MQPEREVPFTCFYTSNISLPRELLGDEPFDPEFAAYGWEDIELGYRLSLARPEAGLPSGGRGGAPPPDDARRSLRPPATRRPGPLHAPQAPSGARPDAAPLARASRRAGSAPAKRLIPPLVPLLSALDGPELPLGKPLLHRVLMCAYYLGQATA